MKKGEIMKITEVLSGGVYVGNLGIYPAKSLRKLTPEEVQQHHKTHEGPIFPPTVEKIHARLSAIEKRINDLEGNQFSFNKLNERTEKRLSVIESRLKEDRNLMIEIEERFDERQYAIENRQEQIVAEQREFRKYSDHLYAITETQAERIYALQKHVESYQKGEMPESKKSNLDYLMEGIRNGGGSAPVCKPNDEYIHVRISRDDRPYEDRTFVGECPCECLTWCEKVLDSMRSGKK